MFENISKGDILILLKRKYPTVFEIHKNEINQTKNLILSIQDESFAEFIVFAFNLQQRYDISLLEEAMNAIQSIIVDMYDDRVENSIYCTKLEQLLKQIKK